MILIAHRGLYDGPDSSLENLPKQIESALAQGFDVEIDVWYIDGTLHLGHNGPTYPTSIDLLKSPGVWAHAKNLAALEFMLKNDIHCFWHENDERTLTSRGYIWTYPDKDLTKHSIMLMPEWSNPEFENLNTNCYGICSDFINKIRVLF